MQKKNKRKKENKQTKTKTKAKTKTKTKHYSFLKSSTSLFTVNLKTYHCRLQCNLLITEITQVYGVFRDNVFDVLNPIRPEAFSVTRSSKGGFATPTWTVYMKYQNPCIC